MQKNNNRVIKFVILVLAVIILSIVFWKPLIGLFSNLERLKEFILNFGVFSPLIFIILIILQVLIAPMPGQAAGFASGYLFGTILGTIYSMIGLIIGSYIAFSLSRKFGRPFVEKVVDKKTLNKFDKLCLNKGIFTLFLIYLLPALPDDAICYIAGLTKIRIKHLMIISTIGRFPGFLVLNLVGDGVASYNPKFSILLFTILMIISIFVYLYRNGIENLMVKMTNSIKTIFIALGLLLVLLGIIIVVSPIGQSGLIISVIGLLVILRGATMHGKKHIHEQKVATDEEIETDTNNEDEESQEEDDSEGLEKDDNEESEENINKDESEPEEELEDYEEEIKH